jgi:mannose-6-phosphate isomerase-like protein (cupin superfamily)
MTTRDEGLRAYRLDQMAFEQLRPGFQRAAVSSDGSLVTVNWFEPDYRSQGQHQHDFDQLSFVLTGSMRFFVGDDVVDVESPGALHIPGGMPHGAEPIGVERVLNLDVYAPVRADYVYLTELEGPDTP